MIPHNKLVLTLADRTAAWRCLESGQMAQGPEVEALEHELAARFRPHGEAVCVSSGTAALYLALRVLKRLGGVRVAIPTYACSSLYHAAAAVGSVHLLDWQETTRHVETEIAIHTYGIGACISGDALTIEDFTHAPGGSSGSRPFGSIGTLSVISFGATKPLGAGGGGAVLGPPDLIERIRDMRDYDGKPDLRERFNWQMSDIHAAIVRARLARLDMDNAWRQETVELYADKMGIELPSGRTWYRFVLSVRNQKTAIEALAASGVESIVPLCPDELLHRQMGLKESSFPKAEVLASSLISVPIWTGMSVDNVFTVAYSLRKLECASVF